MAPMTSGRFRFERFILDPHDRQLMCDDVPIELNTRYLDALALLVREQGKLVSKDRFLDEVWRGVPVTDEALTQCIRTLRRQLGDDVTRPRFIETVVKHGYRFIAPVEIVGAAVAVQPAVLSPPVPQQAAQAYDWRQLLLLSGAGTAGAVFAGVIGGMLYGLSAASQPMVAGMGALSILLVIICLTAIVAVLGGAGVSFGIAVASLAGGRQSWWTIAGGSAGGLIVGAVVKLVGLDALNLLFGQSPGNITGAPEGAILGAGVGFGAWMAARPGTQPGLRRSVVIGLLSGCAAGLFVALSGGRLMAGSLNLLSQSVAESRLRLDPIWNALGETTFGPISRLVTSGLEGALFGGCVVGAMMLARKLTSSAAVQH